MDREQQPIQQLQPLQLNQLSQTELGITWSDGHQSVYPVHLLRRACRCAACVDEWSGKALLDPQSIPADIHPREILPVGRYALRFDWSDGHTTGIYTYDYLRSLCQCAVCQEAGS